MNREILSEINRVREIMGVKLISEAPVNPKWFVSNSGDEIMSTLLDINPNFKGTLDDITEIMSRDIDEIYDPFLREFRQSIDEVMQSQGKSIDDILANQNLRKIVEGKFLNKVKSSSDLLDDFIEEYYVANPAAKKLSDPKVISNVVKKASEGGIKKLENVETVLFKTVDDFVTEDGKKIPEVIKKQIKDAISSSVTGSTTKKVSEEAAEATIDNIILTSIVDPKLANKVKTDKEWRQKIKALLMANDNDISKVESKFKQQVNEWERKVSKSGGNLEENFNSFSKFINTVQGIKTPSMFKYDTQKSWWENALKLASAITLTGGAIVVYNTMWDEWMNSKDKEFAKSIRAKFSFLPTDLRQGYFDYINQNLGGEEKAKAILFNPNVSYKWDTYEGKDYITETEYLTTISLDGKVLKFVSDNEGEDPELLENTFEVQVNSGVETDDQILAKWTKDFPKGVVKVEKIDNVDTNVYYKTNEATVGYTYNTQTKTFDL